MSKINYTEDWYMECPKTKEEWEVFVKIMDSFGVSIFSREFKDGFKTVTSNSGAVCRNNNTYGLKKVTLLKAITLLQRPVETEQQKQIKELQETINKAQQQIEKLKQEVK